MWNVEYTVRFGKCNFGCCWVSKIRLRKMLSFVFHRITKGLQRKCYIGAPPKKEHMARAWDQRQALWTHTTQICRCYSTYGKFCWSLVIVTNTRPYWTLYSGNFLSLFQNEDYLTMLLSLTKKHNMEFRTCQR